MSSHTLLQNLLQHGPLGPTAGEWVLPVVRVLWCISGSVWQGELYSLRTLLMDGHGKIWSWAEAAQSHSTMTRSACLLPPPPPNILLWTIQVYIKVEKLCRYRKYCAVFALAHIYVAVHYSIHLIFFLYFKVGCKHSFTSLKSLGCH